MTPEQLERAQRLERAKTELNGLMKTVPAGVMSGGVTKLDAWKKAMASARRVAASNATDPVKYEEAVVALRACEGNDLAGLAKMAYEKRAR